MRNSYIDDLEVVVSTIVAGRCLLLCAGRAEVTR